jgi:hypothetical protein
MNIEKQLDAIEEMLDNTSMMLDDLPEIEVTNIDDLTFSIDED